MTVFFYGHERNTFDRSDFTGNLREIRGAGVTMVILVPFWFQSDAASSVIAPDGGKTIPDSDFIAACSLVRNEGLELGVKPHINVLDGSERSTLTPADLRTWKRYYLDFLLHYARIAFHTDARIFCVGTELMGISGDPGLWKEIVDSVRTVYPGPLTYSACPQEALSIAFWRELDYIGVNAWFPLSLKDTPAYEDLLL